MKIKIILVGKIENKDYAALQKMYASRIKHYIPIETVIIKPAKIKNLSPIQIMQEEAAKIQQHFQNNYIVAMDKSGEIMSSEKFALHFNKLARQSIKEIAFVIGGPLGLHDAVKKQADMILSLSSMTFPHELAAVMMLEQIYRAQTILKNEKYHK